MKPLLYVARSLVGSLFIVSGLIKANDTVGFGYKLTEYFEPGVLNIPFLIPFATALAAFICVAEILLGVAALLGGKMKITAWALLLLIVFFTFLTFYSAYFHKVTDCGCFGDAIKLTPWQSFTKDVVLLIFVLIIFIGRNKIHLNSQREDLILLPISIILIASFSLGLLNSWNFPWLFSAVVLGVAVLLKYAIKSSQIEWILAIWATLASSLFCYYTYAHLPIKDFRPYKVGANILKGMEYPEGAARDSFSTKLYYQKGSELKEFTLQNAPYDDSTWTWKDTKNVLVKQGYRPPIHDFSITDVEGNIVTNEFLGEEKISFMLVAYDLSKSDVSKQKEINEFALNCEKNGIHFWGLSGSSASDIDKFRHEVNAMYYYYMCDGTALKTIIRSNPGLVMLKKGTVVAKWHVNDFPKLDDLKKKYKF